MVGKHFIYLVVVLGVSDLAGSDFKYFLILFIANNFSAGLVSEFHN
jgi:hypothetical protein